MEGGSPEQEAGRLVVNSEKEPAARLEVGELSSTGKKAELGTVRTLEVIEVRQVVRKGYSYRGIGHEENSAENGGGARGGYGGIASGHCPGSR